MASTFLRHPIYFSAPSPPSHCQYSEAISVLAPICPYSLDVHIYSSVAQFPAVLLPAFHSLSDVRIQCCVTLQRRSDVGPTRFGCIIFTGSHCNWIIQFIVFVSTRTFFLLLTTLQCMLFRCAFPFLELNYHLLSYDTTQNEIVGGKRIHIRELFFDVLA